MPSVTMNPKEDPNEQFHASDMRYLFGKVTEDAEALELLEDFVGSEVLNVNGIFVYFGH